MCARVGISGNRWSQVMRLGQQDATGRLALGAGRMGCTHRGFTNLLVAEERGRGKWRATLIISKSRAVVWEGDPISLSFPSATKALDAAEPMILRIIDRLIENGELRTESEG
jgi:hypothetical protein